MKTAGAFSPNTSAQSDYLDWVDSPNVYAAARAERARFIKNWFVGFGRKQVAAKPNADGLAPLGMTA